MARNPIQFQPGLSLPAFLEQYGTEAKCQDALFQHRWPRGFECPDCGNTTGCRLARGLYQCHRCRHQTSLTAGTIFHATHLPLTTWFLAIYLLTQRKSGISALQLSRELGVAYNTAWKLKHKLLQVMHERNQGEQLSGRIELDDAYLAGIRGYAQQAIAPRSRVISDGLGCFRAFDTPTYVHQRHVTGGGRASVENPEFNWVNTLLGNVKNAITGTYHAIRGQHAPRYLAEFEYRFNRRYDLKAMIPRFLTVATRTPPMPYRFLKMAEPYA